MSDIVSSDSAFDNAINSLRQKGAEFSRVYDTFLSNQSYALSNPALADEWLSIKSKADAVRGTISYINNVVDSASNWLSGVFGLSGTQLGCAACDHHKQLGWLPLLPVAYVTAAVTALTYVIGAIIENNRKISLLRDGYLTGDQYGNNNKGLFGGIENILKIALIGAGIYIALPVIKKQMKAK
jgi:hypothetical protein